MNNINQLDETGFPIGRWDGEFETHFYYKGVFTIIDGVRAFTGYKAFSGEWYRYHIYYRNDIVWGFKHLTHYIAPQTKEVSKSIFTIKLF